MLLLIVFGILDFGRALNYLNDSTQLARAGARWAIVNKPFSELEKADGSPCTDSLAQCIKDNAVTGEMRDNTTVCIDFMGNADPWVGDPVKVTVDVDFTWLPFIGGEGLGGITSTNMTGSAVMRLEQPPTEVERRMHGVSAARAHGENGAVAVMVAALMPLFVLLLAFAVDASHWWVHKAHLQTQVDSGVFAGGLGPWLPVCDPDLEQKARQYSGDYSGAYTGLDPLFNEQYSNETNVHVLINSAAFESQGGANYSEEGLSPCDSLNSPSDRTSRPISISRPPNRICRLSSAHHSGFQRLPWASDLANAHARIQIEKQSGGEGIKPIAVRDDTAYQCAEATLLHRRARPVTIIGTRARRGRTRALHGFRTTSLAEMDEVTMPSRLGARR